MNKNTVSKNNLKYVLPVRSQEFDLEKWLGAVHAMEFTHACCWLDKWGLSKHWCVAEPVCVCVMAGVCQCAP